MAKDLLLDDSGDLKIENGDLCIGFSDEQHIEDLLLAHKGEYKENPDAGIGIEDYLKSPLDYLSVAALEKDILIQLEADGATNINVAFEKTLQVSAEYKDI